MYRCRCEQCDPDPIPTWTERHRARCEAIWLKGLPWSRRAQYFARIEQRRGRDAVITLRYLMATTPSPDGRGR